jgi:hypothetical protein
MEDGTISTDSLEKEIDLHRKLHSIQLAERRKNTRDKNIVVFGSKLGIRTQ